MGGGLHGGLEGAQPSLVQVSVLNNSEGIV
jgi:hypothetical protein